MYKKTGTSSFTTTVAIIKYRRLLTLTQSYYLTKSMLKCCQPSPNVLYNFYFFLIQGPIMHCIIFSYFVSLALLLWKIPQILFFFHDLKFLNSTGQQLYRMSLKFNFSCVLKNRFSLGIFGKNTTEMMCPSQSHS